MKKLLVVLLVLAAACGSASAERESSRPRVTTSTLAPPSLNLDAFPIPARPTDGEGLRCQGLADDVAVRLGDAAVVPVVCADKATNPLIAGLGGLYNASHVLVAYGYSHEVPDAVYRSIAAHELGHAWESAALSPKDRARYMALRSLAGDWRSGPGEDYADVFAISFGEDSRALVQHAPIPPGLIDTLRAEGLLPT